MIYCQYAASATEITLSLPSLTPRVVFTFLTHFYLCIKKLFS